MPATGSVFKSLKLMDITTFESQLNEIDKNTAVNAIKEIVEQNYLLSKKVESLETALQERSVAVLDSHSIILPNNDLKYFFLLSNKAVLGQISLTYKVAEKAYYLQDLYVNINHRYDNIVSDKLFRELLWVYSNLKSENENLYLRCKRSEIGYFKKYDFTLVRKSKNQDGYLMRFNEDQK